MCCGKSGTWIVTHPDGTVVEYDSPRLAKQAASQVGGTWKRKPK